MRSVLALGLLITLCASASAATVHHSKPRHAIVRPSQGVTVPGAASRFPAGPTTRRGAGWMMPARAGHRPDGPCPIDNPNNNRSGGRERLTIAFPRA